MRNKANLPIPPNHSADQEESAPEPANRNRLFQHARPFSRTAHAPAELIRFRELKLDLAIPVWPGFSLHVLTKEIKYARSLINACCLVCDFHSVS
jgi:hypothetical protein